jgi:hypothetical protein
MTDGGIDGPEETQPGEEAVEGPRTDFDRQELRLALEIDQDERSLRHGALLPGKGLAATHSVAHESAGGTRATTTVGGAGRPADRRAD